MTKTLVIDPGHGGIDSGAAKFGLLEKIITLYISKQIREKLKPYNINVILTRTTDIYLTLSARAQIANKAKADAFISVHVNAGGGTGFESFIYNGTVSSETRTLQDCIHDNVMKYANVRDRGKKKANFAVVRETAMAAALTENLFIDTKEDADKLKSSAYLDDLAQGHADGIVEFFKLKKGTSSKPKSKPASTKTNVSFKWIGTNQKGKRVESIYKGREGLNFYDGPRWTNPTGTFGYGMGWKIDNKYLVNGSPMYRVQNSKGKLYWITASPKYVAVKGKY